VFHFSTPHRTPQKFNTGVLTSLLRSTLEDRQTFPLVVHRHQDGRIEPFVARTADSGKNGDCSPFLLLLLQVEAVLLVS
jgi:hypothetical protein